MRFSATLTFFPLAFVAVSLAAPLMDGTDAANVVDIANFTTITELAPDGKDSEDKKCRRGGAGCGPSRPTRLECPHGHIVHVDNGLGQMVPEDCNERVTCHKGHVVCRSPVIPLVVENACAHSCHCVH